MQCLYVYTKDILLWNLSMYESMKEIIVMKFRGTLWHFMAVRYGEFANRCVSFLEALAVRWWSAVCLF